MTSRPYPPRGSRPTHPDAPRSTHPRRPVSASTSRPSVAHAPDGLAANLQAATQRRALQRSMHRRGHRSSPSFPIPDGRLGEIRPENGIWWEATWDLGCIVGKSGVEWDTRMVMHCGTRVAGLLPPGHPGSDLGSSMNNCLLRRPNDLRQAPPLDGAPLRLRPCGLAGLGSRTPQLRTDSSPHPFACPHENP